MFRPIKTSKLADDLYAIKSLMVNFYVYDTQNGLIVFDTGLSKALAKAGFKQLGLDETKVTHVFLTHSDYDHAGGIGLFNQAKICLGKAEEPLITGKKARRIILFNRNIKNYTLLADGEEIRINNTIIKVKATPGHTLGSVMYLLDNQRLWINKQLLIAGDTISLTSKKEIKNFSIIQNQQHQANVTLVNELKREGFFDNKTILTGHHGMIS